MNGIKIKSIFYNKKNNYKRNNSKIKKRDFSDEKKIKNKNLNSFVNKKNKIRLLTP